MAMIQLKNEVMCLHTIASKRYSSYLFLSWKNVFFLSNQQGFFFSLYDYSPTPPQMISKAKNDKKKPGQLFAFILSLFFFLTKPTILYQFYYQQLQHGRSSINYSCYFPSTISCLFTSKNIQWPSNN